MEQEKTRKNRKTPIIRFQRIIQILIFMLFLFLLSLATYPFPTWIDVDWFLRFDPLISLGSMVAARAFIPKLAWAIIILGLAVIMGRLFCGYLCPMGVTVDIADWTIRGRGKRFTKNSFEKTRPYRRVKYLFLIFVTGTSLVGISSVFIFSPLSLATRFYSFVIYPLVLRAANLFIDTFRPVFPSIGLDDLAFTHFHVPYFSTNLFIASLMIVILLLGLFQKRFWCRHLCPAGAILALCSRKPLFRRVVSDKCTKCGRCVHTCPMGAICDDAVATAHSECITCLKCQEVCPENAVAFKVLGRSPSPVPEIDIGRRRALTAGVSGVAAAVITLGNLGHLHDGGNPRALRPSTLIRPPGSLPETDFQIRCVRCGECMKGCLTNTLQPVWLQSGISGLWTPRMTARLAGCAQDCNICGHVCPTGAIRPLSLEDKKFAKVGTARVLKTRCIAWEQNRECLICDEICPYNAISSQFLSGHLVTVPVIDENKCNGCGYCEMKCPVIGSSAIVVEPLGELRLASGSYEEKARELGLVFHARTEVDDHFILDAPESKSSSPLPPGFILDD